MLIFCVRAAVVSLSKCIITLHSLSFPLQNFYCIQQSHLQHTVCSSPRSASSPPLVSKPLSPSTSPSSSYHQHNHLNHHNQLCLQHQCYQRHQHNQIHYLCHHRDSQPLLTVILSKCCFFASVSYHVHYSMDLHHFQFSVKEMILVFLPYCR